MATAAPYRAFVMAMERVEKRLRTVTAALDSAGVPYAVIGGNAVAYWVATVDPSATRTTKDVDLLVNRSDLDRITAVMTGLGYQREDLRSLTLFIDPDEPSRKSGVHLVWAGERVRPSYALPAPSLAETTRGREGFVVLSLRALVRMKLTSSRDIDRVHVADLLSVGLINDEMIKSLPAEIGVRLRAIAETSGDDSAD